jgi:hypothetical protein
MSVPDTNTFSLQDVADYLQKSEEDNLVGLFDFAPDYEFDPNYEGNQDRLYNFRNYGGQWVGKVQFVNQIISDSASRADQSWDFKSYSLDRYVGYDIQVILKYTAGNGNTRPNPSYKADIQIGGLIGIGEDVYNLDQNQSPQWQTSRVQTLELDNVVWYDIPNSDTASGLRWNRRGPTAPGSSGTGVAAPPYTNGPDKFYYTETSGSFVTDKTFWLKSPTSTITASNKTLSFYYAGYGSNVGDVKIYAEVIA